MRKSPTFAPRFCELCGVEYTPSGSLQRFCPSCSSARDVERKRVYEARKHPNRKPKMKSTEVCCVCGAPFACHFEGLPYCNKHYLRMYTHGSTNTLQRKRVNTYEINGDTTTVSTSNGRTFIVDTSDLDVVKRYSWCFSKTGYLVANISGKVTKLHRYLLSPPEGFVVDHINGDPSDNRRCNLRTCEPIGNARNSSVSKNCKSGHLGVRITPNGRYEARICVNRKSLTLGTFDTLDEAIAARREGEIRYFGEFSPSVSRQ